MVSEAALPSGDLLPQADSEESTNAETNAASEAAGETTPGGDQKVRWEVVAVANGLAQASIIQGRLVAEGIPARVNQEPAGVALGLTVGPLGQAEVLVPEPLAEQALRILEQPYQEPEDDEAA
jgi:hypothetical protein